MAKSLCKFRRTEIIDQLGTIRKIVSEPKYICTSCTRVSNDKAYLCRPSQFDNTKSTSAAPVSHLTSKPAKKFSDVAASAEFQPLPIAVGQNHIATVEVTEQAILSEQEKLKLIEPKKLKKLKKRAKKQYKMLKKEIKSMKKLEKKLKKAKRILNL